MSDPSRLSYEASHPTVAEHCDLEAGFAAGCTDVLTFGQGEGRAAGTEEVRKAGFGEAVRRYRITYPCSRCGQLIALEVLPPQRSSIGDTISARRWVLVRLPTS
jgi:hypothetical protein